MDKWSLSALAMTFVMLCFASLASEHSNFEQRGLKQLAEQLDVQYRVISNVDVADCDTLFKSNCFESELSLSLSHAQPHPELALFFSHIAPIAWDDSHLVDIEHLNGDLHRMVIPANSLIAKQPIRVRFKAKFWHVSHSDMMPNYYLVAEGLSPEVIVSTLPQVASDTGLQSLPFIDELASKAQTRRGNGDNLAMADAQWRYDYYQSLATDLPPLEASSGSEWQIIPHLKHTDFHPSKTVSVTGGLKIKSDSYRPSSAILSRLEEQIKSSQDGGTKQHESPILVQVEIAGKVSTEYAIELSENVIKVQASNTAAADYALITLLQLIDANQQLPLGVISDKPRYDFRGLHLDLSRNFMGKHQVLSIMDEMFTLKLNKLHLHLADDEGWRLEVDGLPELTEIGAFRCHDLSESMCLLPQLGSGPSKEATVNGFLTKQDYLDILAYAKARHIDVIPSFDMPGHARAAVKSMEARYRRLIAEEQTDAAKEFLLSDLQDTSEYLSVQFYKDNTVNPCMESTYHFLDTVISYVQQLHQTAGMPLHTYHIGADETAGAWVESPVCRDFIAQNEDLQSVEQLKPYFLKRLAKLVNAKGLVVAGWSDGMHTLVSDPEFQGQQVNVWDALFWDGHKIADEFAQHQWKTIISSPDVTYFDFPYLNHPDETGYYWASKQTDTFKVFQFQPEHLGNMSDYWLDRMGNEYLAQESASQRPAYAGVQAQLWTEAVRTNKTVQYLMFPRLHAFAERAWHRSVWEGEPRNKDIDRLIKQDWARFSSALVNTHLPKLVKSQPGFRLPPPGIKIEESNVYANSLWPSLLIEYQVDGGSWQTYTGPVKLQDNMQFRTRLDGSEKTSRIILP